MVSEPAAVTTIVLVIPAVPDTSTIVMTRPARTVEAAGSVAILDADIVPVCWTVCVVDATETAALLKVWFPTVLINGAGAEMAPKACTVWSAFNVMTSLKLLFRAILIVI